MADQLSNRVCAEAGGGPVAALPPSSGLTFQRAPGNPAADLA